MAEMNALFQDCLDQKRTRRTRQAALTDMEKVAILDRLRERDNELKRIRSQGAESVEEWSPA